MQSLPVLRVSYDDIADVLYLSVGAPDRRAKSNEDSAGLIWRVSPEGALQGVTVLGFNSEWAEKQSELVSIISAKLNVGVEVLEEGLITLH